MTTRLISWLRTLLQLVGTQLTDIVRVQTPEDALAELSLPPEETPASCPSCEFSI
jgi:hypothetical protein